jgi:hypothetical protein
MKPLPRNACFARYVSGNELVQTLDVSLPPQPRPLAEIHQLQLMRFAMEQKILVVIARGQATISTNYTLHGISGFFPY